MNKPMILNTQTSYDNIALEYAEKYKEEMEDKPFDTWLSLSSGMNDPQPQMLLKRIEIAIIME